MKFLVDFCFYKLKKIQKSISTKKMGLFYLFSTDRSYSNLNSNISGDVETATIFTYNKNSLAVSKTALPIDCKNSWNLLTGIVSNFVPDA